MKLINKAAKKIVKPTDLRDSTELLAVVTALAGEGLLLSTTRRDGARVYDLTLDNWDEQHTSLPVGRWQVIYAYWPESGEIIIEFLKHR